MEKWNLQENAYLCGVRTDEKNKYMYTLLGFTVGYLCGYLHHILRMKREGRYPLSAEEDTP